MMGNLSPFRHEVLRPVFVLKSSCQPKRPTSEQSRVPHTELGDPGGLPCHVVAQPRHPGRGSFLCPQAARFILTALRLFLLLVNQKVPFPLSGRSRNCLGEHSSRPCVQEAGGVLRQLAWEALKRSCAVQTGGGALPWARAVLCPRVHGQW